MLLVGILKVKQGKSKKKRGSMQWKKRSSRRVRIDDDFLVHLLEVKTVLSFIHWMEWSTCKTVIGVLKIEVESLL